MTSPRYVIQQVSGQPTSDGAGVKLTRMIGTPALKMLDPFLMLDCFESDQPQDYLAGFPDHPHRGFETVTYILDGRMRHADNAGHESVIEAGGVQWMTAGKGIVHSEMPEQQDGLLKGFQLWVNLPAEHKMTEPNYQEYRADKVPAIEDENGNVVRVIAGELPNGVKGPVITAFTQAQFLDVSISGESEVELNVPQSHQGFVYVVEGEAVIAGEALHAYQLGILSEGDKLTISSSQPARVFVVSGEAIKEPVAWGGPFVMNTHEQVMQAFRDFQNNQF